MLGHPTKYELTEYAEALVDGKPMSARIARHIASCQACKDYVNAQRESFAFLSDAPLPECSAQTTAQILAAARAETRNREQPPGLWRRAYVAAKATACAAGIVLVAAWVFTAALDEPGADFAVRPPAVSRLAPSPAPSEEELQRKASEIRSLASAVDAQSDAPASLWERQHRHMVVALHADRAAAMAALKRNPGCVRASRLATANLEREAQALRTLYVEQGR